MNPSHLMRWSVILLLSCASGVEAGQLSIRFAGGGSEVELAALESVELEIVWTMATTDTTKSGARLTGLELRLGVNDGDGEPLSSGLMVDSVTGLSGWDLSGTTGVGGAFSEAGFFLSAIDPAGVGIAGNGTSFETVVATVLIRSSGGLGDAFITIRHSSSGDPLPAAFKGAATWMLRWQSEVSGPNQYDLGVGNPGDNGPQWDPDHGYELHEPLIVHAGVREGCPVTGKALELLEYYPGIHLYRDPLTCGSNLPTAYYGRLMNSGSTPVEAAATFIELWAHPNYNVFGIADLGLLVEERTNAVGFGNSTVFAYRQYLLDDQQNEILVENSMVRLLVSHGVSPPRVAYVSARGLTSAPLGGFRADTLDSGQALGTVQVMEEYNHLAEWSQPVMVIYDEPLADAIRAWKITARQLQTPPFEAYTFFVNAADGRLVHARNEVFRRGLEGRITGYVTPGVGPDLADNPEVEVALPGAGLRLLGTPRATANTFFSGPDGQYAIPYSGPDPVLLRADLFGEWVTVASETGDDMHLEALTGNEDVLDFVFNTAASPAAASDLTTAQVNTLLHVTSIHDFYKQRQPGFLGIDFSLRCLLNTPNDCGASAFPGSDPFMSFGADTGGVCPNSAYSTSITHEYGHILQHTLGIRPDGGPFGEGFADTLTVLRFDDPVLFQDGWGKGTFGRNVETADLQAVPACPPNPSGHLLGQLLGGTWWDIKQEMQIRLNPAVGLEVARQLFTDWSQFTLGGIELYAEEPMICNSAHTLTVIEVLIADDLAYGDGLIANGTPHDCAICIGFSLHGLACPSMLLGGQCSENNVPDRCEPDCNGNQIPDSCDVLTQTGTDCTPDGTPTECEPDCNANGVPDSCDILMGTSFDCSSAPNGVPDECEDCNANDVADACEIAANPNLDCPAIAVCPDPLVYQCTQYSNGILDSCEPDCNGNGAADSCDIAVGTSRDCNANGTADECEGSLLDCNGNGTFDACDLLLGASADCNNNIVPDECDIGGISQDCDLDGVPDECQSQTDCNANQMDDRCETGIGTAPDCNGNRIPDECDVAVGTSTDCPGDPNVVPDECEEDCNRNGTADTCDIDRGLEPDCDANRVPDGCDLLACAAADCNGNAIPDECDIAGGTSADLNQEGVPDECLPPPMIVSVTSVAYHAAFPPGCTVPGPNCWPGGEIEVCVDPEFGAIEPRLQISIVAGIPVSSRQLFLRVTFDQPVNPASLTAATVVPDPGLEAQITQPAGGPPQTVEIRFMSAGTAAEVPPDSYRIDLAGLATPAGARAGGACAGFPICYVIGDVNCDGRATFGDSLFVEEDSSLLISDPDADPRADVNRSGIVTTLDRRAVETSPSFLVLGVPVACRCPCAETGPCAVQDCNGNGQTDACELDEGSADDCNQNRTPDDCDITSGTSLDCNLNGTPDECESGGCNNNGIPDECDIASGTSPDCNLDTTPDECEPGGCNDNGTPDECDIAAGTSADCNLNEIPDECETDCNGNGTPDDCDCEPGDYDVDGDIDLFDSGAFCSCFTLNGLGLSAKCACTFDVHPAPATDGDVDLDDWNVLRGMMTGPEGSCVSGGGNLTAGSSGPSLGGIGSAVVRRFAIDGDDEPSGGGTEPEPPDSWMYVSAMAGVEVRSLGGSEPLSELSLGGQYEIHYQGVVHPVQGYTLMMIAPSPAVADGLVSPPTEGVWAATGLFAAVGSPAEQSGSGRVIALDDRPGNAVEAAEDELCVFAPTQVGEQTIRVVLYVVDVEVQTTFESVAEVSVVVVGAGDVQE